jgi:two-component system phosphate regulon sensor histidine kinase PhoR
MNIRQKFIVMLLAIGLVPTLGVGLLAFGTISNELNKRTTNELSSLDTKQQQTINALLQSKQEAVIKLSNAYDFQTALEQYLPARSQPGHDNIETILHGELAQVPSMVAINLADLSGNVIASTQPSLEGTPLQQQPGFYGEGQGPVINIMEDKTDGLDELYISTTISVNKQDSAILRIIFRIDDLIATMQDYTGLGSTGETILTEPSSSGKDLSLLPLRFSTASQVEPFKRNKSGQKVDYRGHKVMVSSRPVGFSNWTISTKIDTVEALAPIAQLRDALILISIITAVIITLAALYLTRIITEPILRLAQVSERIGRGDFDARVDLRRNDEIGALASSINSLGTSLKAFVSGLESQRNHLAIVLDSTNDTILAVNQRGIITTANQAAVELTRRPLGDLLGRAMNEVFVMTSELQPFSVNLTAPGTNTYSNIEYADVVGTKHYLKLIVARLHATQSESEQTIITIRDETKNRELENMKVDFVSMAAHELRTPLAAIRGYIELINLKLKNMPPEISGYLSQSLKSAVELGGLINNLLDVSRIERGTLTLNMEETDLATSVSKAIDDVGFAAKDKKVQLHYEGPHTGCKVAADEIALREVISNLLTNAIKYTPSGGHVEVTLDTINADASYQLSVADTGVGVPASSLPHLFTKFFRVHGGLDSGSTGTGLGLFIAKSIIERHEGTIRAESHEGKGSTFSFTIPILTPERLASIQAREQAKGETTRRHRGWITKNTTR